MWWLGQVFKKMNLYMRPGNEQQKSSDFSYTALIFPFSVNTESDQASGQSDRK